MPQLLNSMVMKRLIYFLLMLTCIAAKAQENLRGKAPNEKTKTIVSALDNFQIKHPIEKIHIQFDKPYYALGDTLWMKAYVVNESNQLSALSKILHVELVNDADGSKRPISSLPLTKGLAWGAITLSDSLLTGGDCHIYAYTNWVRNFGPEYFFNKSIKIG